MATIKSYRDLNPTIEFAQRCGYLGEDVAQKLDGSYHQLIGQLVKMINEADKWLIRS